MSTRHSQTSAPEFAAPEFAAPALARLSLLDGFDLRSADRSVELPPSAQRLLAFLALRTGPRQRSQVAGVLWPEMLDEQAAAALRSAVWRVRRARPDLLAVSHTQVRLAGHVAVDVAELTELARRLVRHNVALTRHELEQAAMGGCLLPGWHDDWILLERAQLHQMQVHGLEALGARLLAAGSHGAAVDAALGAIRLDPLRESAHRLLVRIHLDQGNVSDALRQHRDFSRLVVDELGVEPSHLFAQLMAPVQVADRGRRDATHTLL